MNASDTTLVRSWVSQPNTRGTFDLVLSCAVTVFLCSWSSMCVNVPRSDHSKKELFWDKWHMFCLSMLGPEIVFMLALGQYVAAYESIKLFHDQGYKSWTIKHGFYANMGGFVFQPSGWKPFPVDAKQVLYLVKSGYIVYPDVDEAIIDDKNKSDGLARFITSCQIVWFILNVIARPPQHLAVTTIEITTIGFIFCTLGVNICWREKPMDISTAIVLHSEHTIDQILLDGADAAAQPYRLTPLDFASREEWIATKLWQYNVNILHKLGVVRQRPHVRPIQNLSSFIFPKLSRAGALVALAVALAYSAIFMGAWNIEFPSAAERLLWRICTSLTMALTLAAGFIEVILPAPRGPQKDEESDLDTAAEGGRGRGGGGKEAEEARKSHPSNRSKGRRSRGHRGFLSRLADRHFNNSPDRDPALDVPLKSMLFTQPICALYAVCRVYVLLEDIIGLRALPASTFKTVDWTVYWPHI